MLHIYWNKVFSSLSILFTDIPYVKNISAFPLILNSRQLQFSSAGLGRGLETGACSLQSMEIFSPFGENDLISHL